MLFDIGKEYLGGLGKVLERLIVAVVHHDLSEIFPQPLDQIEVRRIGRKKNKLNFGVLEKFFD